jgi:hypothetical protein
MLKKVVPVVILSVVLLSACGQGQTNSTPTPVPPTPSATHQHRPSPTPGPSYTPQPTFTSTLGSIPVSTFMPALAVTFTLAPAAQCPPIDPNAVVSTPELPWVTTVTAPLSEQSILEQLNAGKVQAVRSAFSGYAEEFYTADFLHDLTGDGIPEFILALPISYSDVIFVFGCKEGHFETLLQIPPVYEYAPRILSIQDMNMDGEDELVITQTTCHYCLGVQIFEWDGNQFQSLAREWYEDSSTGMVDYSAIVGLMGIASARLEDLDGNGTVELIVEGGTPSYLGGISGGEGPFRAQTVVYGWDGRYFAQQSQHYAPPNFRFEAIQDGDTESSRGNFDAAFSFYLQAINDTSLKSWTRDAWSALLEENYQLGKIDYPNIIRMPFNQTEYDQLSAYAWYRIMLLHLLRGHEENEAYIVYKWLLDHYPEGNPGYPYAQMATSLWIEYQASSDLTSACGQAREFADQHKEILHPLGNHGLFDPFYSPLDVCPFSVTTPPN